MAMFCFRYINVGAAQELVRIESDRKLSLQETKLRPNSSIPERRRMFLRRFPLGLLRVYRILMRPIGWPQLPGWATIASAWAAAGKLGASPSWWAVNECKPASSGELSTAFPLTSEAMATVQLLSVR